MKKSITLLAFALCIGFFAQAQVGVGTTTPDANAQLDVVSTDKGVLLPRLTNTQAKNLRTGAVNPALDADDDGMVIYNTDEQCIQVFKWFTTPDTGSFECVAIASGGSSGNAGVVKVNVTGAALAATNKNTGHPSYMSWTSQTAGDFHIFGTTGPGAVNITATELNLSSAPTTNWPENEANQTLTGGIWTNENQFEGLGNTGTGITADAWRENDIPGQVHIWRIIVQGNPNNNSGGEFEVRLRNPESGFVTGYAQLVPAVSGLYSQTFTLTTIADDASLPSGGGDGYVLEVRANSGALGVWIESITRISLYNE